MQTVNETPTWESCDECMKHGDNTPFIVESCSSVAIETRQTPWQVAVGYFRKFHESGHKEPQRG
jgi:hypothetical protein